MSQHISLEQNLSVPATVIESMVKPWHDPTFEKIETGTTIDKVKQEFTIRTNALTMAEFLEILNKAIDMSERDLNQKDVDSEGELEFWKKLKDKINIARNSVLPS